MDDHQMAEVRGVLKRHLLQIKATFENSTYDEIDSYAFLAGNLRVLLCDGERPVLIAYARELGIPLKIVKPLLAIDHDDNMILGINMFAGAWGLPGGPQLVTIEKYLDEPIGVLPFFSKNKKTERKTFTPKQIIKWLANKDGIAHLDLKKPLTFKMLKEIKGILNGQVKDEYLVRSTIYQITHWVFHAIQYVLSPYGLEEQILERLSALGVDELEGYEEIKKRIKSMKPILGGYLIGTYCYGSAIGPPKKFNDAFSWNALLKILYQLGKEEKVIYEAAVNTDYFFRIAIDEHMDLHCQLLDKNSVIVKTSFKGFGNSKYFNQYFYLCCQLRKQNGHLELAMYANGELIDNGQVQHTIDHIEIQEHVIGGSIERNRNGAAIISSFMIYDAWLDKGSCEQLEARMWLMLVMMLSDGQFQGGELNFAH